MSRLPTDVTLDAPMERDERDWVELKRRLAELLREANADPCWDTAEWSCPDESDPCSGCERLHEPHDHE
jgi:hypothetical protein